MSQARHNLNYNIMASRDTPNNKDSIRSKKKIKMYNNSKLQIGQSNTIIFCDWDDTFFPTAWINENNIDLTDLRSRYKYARYFDYLDKYLYNTIRKIKKHGDIIIITNAMRQWVLITLTILPRTKKILSNVPIISARENYQNRCDMQDWKKYAFRTELSRQGRKHYKNIISIGDAHYEYQALIDLYHWKFIPHKYLKSVKFTRSADCIDIINQIKLIGKEIEKVSQAQRHLDLSIDIDIEGV